MHDLGKCSIGFWVCVDYSVNELYMVWDNLTLRLRTLGDKGCVHYVFSLYNLSIDGVIGLFSVIVCWGKTYKSRSTVKAANRKFISFMSFENITFIYRTFQVWAWPLLDKRSTSEEYVYGLTDSIYKLVTWCVGHVVLVNNPILFRSHLIFDSARA